MPFSESAHAFLGHGRHRHIKKDLTTETITETEYITAFATNPAVIVWVDTKGSIVSTETRTDFVSGPTVGPETTSSTAETTTKSSAVPFFTAPPPTPAAPPTSSSLAPSAPPAVPTTSTAQAVPAVQTSPTADAPNARIVPGGNTTPSTGSIKQGSDAGSGQFSGLGIGYDIIDNKGNCKDAATVANDFDTMTGYSIVRIYDTVCNEVALVTAEAAQRGMKVFAGVRDLSGDITSAVQEILSQAGSNLNVIDTISIGNEWVQDNGPGSVPVVIAAIGAARAALGGVYSGSIVTVDTSAALINYPALCAASDYCAANCYAFFDPNTAAADAGSFVKSQAAAVANANSGKTVVITESGWAWADHSQNPNPRATQDQQAAAISSLRDAFSSNLILFQAFDTLYKGGGTEGYFGMYDHDD